MELTDPKVYDMLFEKYNSTNNLIC